MSTLYLFYADWCPHCQNYKQTWEEIRKECSKNGIKTESIESSIVQEMQSGIKENKTGIILDMVEGYPTLIFKKNAGDITAIENRDKENVLKVVIKGTKQVPQVGGCTGDKCMFEHKNMVQVGGTAKTDEYFKEKYMRYKKKYLNLKYNI